jgi:hypothetical protein
MWQKKEKRLGKRGLLVADPALRKKKKAQRPTGFLV